MEWGRGRFSWIIFIYYLIQLQLSIAFLSIWFDLEKKKTTFPLKDKNHPTKYLEKILNQYLVLLICNKRLGGRKRNKRNHLVQFTHLTAEETEAQSLK